MFSFSRKLVEIKVDLFALYFSEPATDSTARKNLSIPSSFVGSEPAFSAHQDRACRAQQFGNFAVKRAGSKWGSNSESVSSFIRTLSNENDPVVLNKVIVELVSMC